MVPAATDPGRVASLFNLSMVETEAYRLLLARGVANATGAAPLLGKSRSRAYEVLRGLVAKGLAVETPGRPAGFRLVPVGQALSALRDELELQSELVADALTTVKAADDPPRPEEPQATFFHGWAAMEREAARIVRSARENALVFISDGADPLAASDRLRAALLRVSRGGVPVRVFCADTPWARRLAEDMAQLRGAKVQVARDLPPFACVLNERMVLYPLPPGEPGGTSKVALRLEGPQLAAFTSATLERALEEGCGPQGALDGPHAFVDAYTTALANAATSVENLAGAGWTHIVPPDLFRHMRQAIEAAAARGVALRAVINDDPMELDFIQRMALPEPWELRSTRWTPFWMSIVDGSEMFQALPRPDGRSLFRRSRDPDEVRFWREVLEGAWAQGKPILLRRKTHTRRR